jgi:hypothetical protein
MKKNRHYLDSLIQFPNYYPIFRKEKNGYYIDYFLTDKRSNKFSVFLPATCNEKKLPPGIYGLGLENRKQDWLWDNFDYDIFFDEDYVTNFDIIQWKKEKINFYSEKLFAPNIELSFKEMKAYCASMGKELLNARVFDAAAAFHFRKTESGDRYDARSLFPWKGRVEDQFLFVAQQDHQFKFQKKYCQKIFTKECLKTEDFGVVKPRAKSKMGLNNALGGFLEAVWNKVHPAYNLIPSSFLFSIRSTWHQVGRRVIWNGEKGEKGQVIWKDQQNNYGDFPTIHSLPIAFRCMRTVKK